MKRLMGKFIMVSILASGSLLAVAQETGMDEGHEHGPHGKGRHHDGMRGRFGNPERMLERMTRHLDLDDTQAQQVSNIFTAAKPEIDVLRQNFHDNRQAMSALTSSDPDYSVNLQDLSAANAELAAQMTLLHGRVRADIEAVLTPEQQATLRERGERMNRRWSRHGSDQSLD